MRKSTVKQFKRFDLLLRNEESVCIIDWKFSKVNADQKINTAMFAKKNRQYFQLARKEYNANVRLKFYCFHQRADERFHRYTFADFNYEKEEVEIEEGEMEAEEEGDEEPLPEDIERLLRDSERKMQEEERMRLQVQQEKRRVQNEEEKKMKVQNEQEKMQRKMQEGENMKMQVEVGYGIANSE